MAGPRWFEQRETSRRDFAIMLPFENSRLAWTWQKQRGPDRLRAIRPVRRFYIVPSLRRWLTPGFPPELAQFLLNVPGRRSDQRRPAGYPDLAVDDLPILV